MGRGVCERTDQDANQSVSESFPLTDKAEHPPLPQAFAALGVRTSLLRGLAEAKFETPSEIQNLLIPKALAGGDFLGQARTGTGKTAAFGIPILQNAARGVAT